jgi:very-short-patch-repair endonuclease
VRRDTFLHDEAKRMRENPTPQEAILWEKLDQEKVGYLCKTQVPVFHRYILDFVIPYFKLNIEVDGYNHFTEVGKKEDKERDDFLRCKGWYVLRFINDMVDKHINEVVKVIEQTIGVIRSYPAPDDAMIKINELMSSAGLIRVEVPVIVLPSGEVIEDPFGGI